MNRETPKKSPASRKSGNERQYVAIVHSTTSPAIGAYICRGLTPDGHSYLYFKIARSWKNGNREGYSDRFYERHAEAISEVARMATDWIKQHPEAADDPAQVVNAP